MNRECTLRNTVNDRKALRWYMVMLALCATGALGVSRHIFPMTLVEMIVTLDISNVRAASIGSAHFVAYTLSALFWGRLCNPKNNVMMLIVGMASLGLVLSLAGIAPGCTVLLYPLCGLSAGVLWIGATSLITSWFPPEERSLPMGVTLSGEGLAATIIGFLYRSAFRCIIWHQAWFILGITIMVIAAVWYLILRRPFLPVYHYDGLIAATRQRQPVYVKGLLQIKRYRTLVCIYMMQGTSRGIWVTFLMPHLQRSGVSVEMSAYAFSVLGLAIIFGPPVSSVWAQLRPRDRVLFGFLGLQTVAILALCIDYLVLSSALFAIVALASLCLAGIPATLSLVAAETVPPEAYGSAIGVLTFSFGIGAILGQPIGGWLSDWKHTYTYGLVVAASLSALAGVNAGVRMTDRRK